MDIMVELRSHLLDAFDDMGYTVYRYPSAGGERLDDIVRVRGPKQFFEGMAYLALPQDFAGKSSAQILEEGIVNYASIDILALFFEVTHNGIEVYDVTNRKYTAFSYMEFITAVKRLPSSLSPISGLTQSNNGL